MSGALSRWGLSIAWVLLLSCGGDSTNPREEGDAARPSRTDSAAATQETCPAPVERGQGEHRAGLVLTYGDGTSQALCVAFGEDGIDGYRLLQEAGLELSAEFYPAANAYAICRITGDGKASGCDFPGERCFCDPERRYWVFWTRTDEGWRTSEVTVSGAVARHGTVHGQRWGPSDTPPPPCTFEDICGAASGP